MRRKQAQIWDSSSESVAKFYLGEGEFFLEYYIDNISSRCPQRYSRSTGFWDVINIYKMDSSKRVKTMLDIAELRKKLR